MNRVNDSRIETLFLLFFFSMWARYFVAASEMTTKKLAVGLGATILIAQLNYTDAWDYSWKILSMACLASGTGVVGSMFPFPNSALKEAEERWSHALRQTAHLFHLLVAAFSCTHRGELDAKMLLVRIEQTIGHLLANRDAIKARIREAEYEFPVIAYHWLFGTHNNYTYSRFLRHFDSFEQMYAYMHCMLFAVHRLPFDDFHNVAVAHLHQDLHAVSHALAGWVAAVAGADRHVHRAHLLAQPLARYTQSVAALFQNYVRFRANMYFNGKLFLVDMIDGQKALLRQSADRQPSRARRRRATAIADDEDDAGSLLGTAASSMRGAGAGTARSLALHRSLSPPYSTRLSRFQDVAASSVVLPSVRSATALPPFGSSAAAGSVAPTASATAATAVAAPPSEEVEEKQRMLRLPHTSSAGSLALSPTPPTSAAPASSSTSPPPPATAAPASPDDQAPTVTPPAVVTLHIDVTDADGAEAAVATGPDGGDANADAGRGGGDNYDNDDGKDDPEADPDAPDTTPAPADFTWTSDDVMSLNFFFFQINEFTKRALKFAVEPGEEYAHDLPKGKTGAAAAGSAGSAAATGASTEGRAAGWFDPTSLYHLGSVGRVPVFLLAFIRSTLRSQWAGLRASCVWDEQRFIESAKLALAIVLASANELTPRSWTPIYERKSHGWWAPVTVAFTMSDNLGTHVTSMVLRVLGTLAGAVFGYVAKVVCQGELVALVAVLVVWNVLTTVQRTEPKFGYAWLVAG